MSLGHGAKIVTKGIAFAYDMGNSKKSWKGKPTTNLLSNGHFSGGNHVSQFSAGGSYGSYAIDYFPNNPGHSDYVLRQNGGQNGEYEMNVTLAPSTTYTVSCWVAYSPDSDLNTQILHTRWYYSGGNSTTGGAGTLVETKQMGELTWERRYVTFTTNSTATGAFQWYLGYATGGTTGFRYFTDLQIEADTSAPTPFVDGTRSNTEALIDWTGNNTITADSLSYNSDGTFSFNGTNTYVNVTGGPSFNMYCLDFWAYFNNAVPNNDSAIGGPSTYQTIITFNNAGTPGVNLGGWTSGASNEAIHIWSNSGGTSSYNGMTYNRTAVPVGWHNVVFNWNGSNYDIWVDGVKTTIYVGPNGHAKLQPITSFQLGRNTANYYFNGKISSTKMYNAQLNDQEVAQNFNALRGRYGI